VSDTSESTTAAGYRDYGYANAAACHAFSYLQPAVLRAVRDLPVGPGLRVLDVGCGNGYLAGVFADQGCSVVGIDLSETGIAQARAAYPKVRFEILPADDMLLKHLGEPAFDVVVSTEVVEHLYDPQAFVRGCRDALKMGGRFVCSTPYHGYLKNLAISQAGVWDTHANPLWDGGHIKLWSRKTLTRLLAENGFGDIQFQGAGRVAFLWGSMILSGNRIKPNDRCATSVP